MQQQNENDKNDKNKFYSQTIVQGRLTKSEWNNMEIPVSPDELTVIKLIRDSYQNVQLKMNHHSSMIGILKTSSSPEMHAHLYQKHFEQLVHEMVKTFQLVPAFSCDADSKQGDGCSGSSGRGTSRKGVGTIPIFCETQFHHVVFYMFNCFCPSICSKMADTGLRDDFW